MSPSPRLAIRYIAASADTTRLVDATCPAALLAVGKRPRPYPRWKRLVHSVVFSLSHYLKVLDSIGSAVLVDVMDVFVPPKGTAEMFLHHQPMHVSAFPVNACGEIATRSSVKANFVDIGWSRRHTFFGAATVSAMPTSFRIKAREMFAAVLAEHDGILGKRHSDPPYQDRGASSPERTSAAGHLSLTTILPQNWLVHAEISP